MDNRPSRIAEAGTGGVPAQPSWGSARSAALIDHIAHADVYDGGVRGVQRHLPECSWRVASGDWQTPAALLVPIFKIIERNLFCRYLNGKDDLKPEMVVFGVEMTKALFVSSSMQQAASVKTSVMLALIDLVLMLVSLFDLGLMLKGVQEIADKMGVGTHEAIAAALVTATKYPALKQ
jgi:hypothetical protein